AVAERAEPVRREERRAGEGGLGTERAVELDGVAARLVHLQEQLRAPDHHRGAHVLRALLRGEERDRFLRDPRRVRDEVEALDELPARLVLRASAGGGIRADLLLAVADGLRRDAAARLEEGLLDVRALARDEEL